MLLGLACTSPVAAQTTLTFENLSNPSNPNGFNNQGFVVTQNGFTVTTTGTNGFASVSPNGNASNLNYTGSVALLNNTSGGITTLTQNNGLTFTLNSIDIANVRLQSLFPSMTTVTFIGNVQGGGVVTQTFTTAMTNALQTVTFGSGFTNLTSVSFDQRAPGIQFDNIVVVGAAPSAVPEPSQTAALGLGLLGLSGLVLKARKRKAVRA